MNLNAIPGLAEAIARESFVRDAAFLPVTESIAGIDVKPLEFFHINALRIVGSPFLRGGQITGADVGAFLWLVSPKYNPQSKWRRWLFLRKIRNKDALALIEGISKYLSDAFGEAPGGDGQKSNTISYYSTTAAMVDWLASEYGWSEQAIIHMPVKRGFQYMKAIIKRKNPKAILTNPSQRISGEWLNQRQAMQ